MTRRVGFGDDPSGGGGFSWLLPVVLIILIAAAAAILDPTLTQKVQDWLAGVPLTSWSLRAVLFGLTLAFAVYWILSRLARAFSNDARRPGGGSPTGSERAERTTKPRPFPARLPRARRTARRNRSYEEDFGDESDTAPAAGSQTASQAGGCFAIGFLIFWLCGWTVGIVFAVGAFLSSVDDGAIGPEWFLLVWIVFAVFGWFVALRILLGLIRSTLFKQ